MRKQLREKLDLLGGNNEQQLTDWLNNFGLFDGQRATTNLGLIAEQLDDSQMLTDILEDAFTVADPDTALNLLERAFNCIDKDTLLAVLKRPERRKQLLTILGGSPFLAGILCRRNVFVDQLLLQDDIDHPRNEAEMLADLRRTIPEQADFQQLKSGLRQYKVVQILRIGSRDLCGMASLEEVTAELSDLAAASLQRAYEVCGRQLQDEFGTPLENLESGDQRQAAMTILGMGKFGGNELNFSSDIDLIYCYSSTNGETTGGSKGEKISLHRYFLKLAELVSRALHQVTEDGFVFRVDTRLRPDGNSGDLAISVTAAETYYESWGQSWERAAMIKARPVAGSIPLGVELLKRLKPFIYRRYLDFGMIEDIKMMKQKINASLNWGQERERNLKLGRGGIREIEFFIQALQLINAGTRPNLQYRNSLRMLKLLEEEALITTEEQELLSSAYRFLRTVEHRIQIVQEQQTHSLPTRPNELLALARRCGFVDVDGFSTELERHRLGVANIFKDLFHSADEEEFEVRPEINFVFDRESDPDLVKDLLEEKGFSNPDAAYESLLWLRGGDPHKRLTARGRRCMEKLAPLLLTELLDSANPDQALNNLERFIRGIRARTSYFSLLAENSEIVKLLIALFSSSQLLSRIFIQRPELLDTLVARSYATESKDREMLAASLSEQMRLAEDYEMQLDGLRRFRNEEFLRIALRDLQGHIKQGEGAKQLSWVAEVCLEQAIRMARQELVTRFGAPYPVDAEEDAEQTAFAIVGMGKLGGWELNYHSDLDIIFIYDSEGQTRPAAGTDPVRFRQLSNHEYFAKLAQRIITALTLVTREGTVYEIDTRLRPSGNQGPLVTSYSAFKRYHRETAQPWERQAMTKARVVCGPPEFAGRLQQLISELAFDRPMPDNLQSEIYRLRSRMEKEIAKETEAHFNIKTGRGGMVDVEFIAQYLQLRYARQIKALWQQNTLEVLRVLAQNDILHTSEAKQLINGYKFLRRLENKLRLLHDQSINELAGDQKSLRKITRSLGYGEKGLVPEKEFLEQYHLVTEGIRQLFENYLNPHQEVSEDA
ncbi:bifunctional [glutamate--ammonia ligase]-adenylyl-L-tyrosine phosphorylase/[glutamate--ammonia-ligase] adenylyltransferase [Malonomonas rubra]|uniref:bifunctional [glutamate--ammonia ligase]-adenylyl-L-tyrosine phosphorylase/[glutamate--ammonia-ligase] adenylyltransferase n=1 Tax=Malonomonas rubra TaxID=57040 RepID=UPI0026F159A2|nr:bifunctional [glutamate--ammonia ligase]-adenylyl-L-tyrosine phosphorylase/[glutamate--ammonia-ligase] adenylyltransferase [Malonomonas rubra]